MEKLFRVNKHSAESNLCLFTSEKLHFFVTEFLDMLNYASMISAIIPSKDIHVDPVNSWNLQC